MKNIRVAVRPVVNNANAISGSVVISRGDGWEPCGVFTLTREEWAGLLAFCSAQEIHITYEQGLVPIEIAAAPPIGE